jgi:hypothetical protein
VAHRFVALASAAVSGIAGVSSFETSAKPTAAPSPTTNPEHVADPALPALPALPTPPSTAAAATATMSTPQAAACLLEVCSCTLLSGPLPVTSCQALIQVGEGSTLTWHHDTNWLQRHAQIQLPVISRTHHALPWIRLAPSVQTEDTRDECPVLLVARDEYYLASLRLSPTP